MRTVVINNGGISAVKADFVKKEVSITIKVGLTEEMLFLREDLATLVFLETPITVTIQTRQPSLPGFDSVLAASALGMKDAKGVDRVELRDGMGHSVVLKGEEEPTP